VWTLFVDREGAIWVGSAGLFQLRGRGLIEHANVASGLPGEIVWTYARDRQGHLLAGTNRCLARAADGRWTCVPGTENRVVRSVVFPPQGGMFLGGAPSDLLYIDDAGHVTSLGEPDRPDHNLLALALGPEGDLWIGTKAGLLRLRGAKPGPLEPVALPGASPTGRIASLLVVGDQLWVAVAPGGVYVLDPHAGGTWRGFGVADGFLTPSMSYLIRRADGQFCVAYTEAVGLTCFRSDGRGVTALAHLSTAQGLTTGMVYLLGEDRARRLWVGTGDGVDVISGDVTVRTGPLSIDHFDQSDGLAGNDSAAKAFLLDGDGSLWLGATGGATHVFAQHYAGPPAAPRIAFLDGRVGDRSIHEAAGLEVPHDRGGLTVELAATSLLDPKRIEYQVRLSPLESDWSSTHQRQARYPGLVPGSYRFEARARIDAGRWGPASELRFAVRPAWWQHGWLYALIAIGGVAAMSGGFAWRQRAVLRRRTRQLHAQSDASFHAVIDLMPDMISVHRDHKLLYLNRASRRMLGDRAVTTGMREIVHPDDQALVDALFARVRALEQVSEVIEIRMRGADGSWRLCEVSGVRVEIGGAVTVVASGRDVTERKRLRAQLMVSDRMASLGTLAAGIAHEINNPLAYVTGNLEAMAEAVQARGAEAPDRAELSLAINEARDGAERVRKIVQGLRSFSRPEEEKRVALALPGVLEAAIRLTANEVRHRAQLVRELGPTPRVVADDGRLTQVFINLLINAAHAIPEGHSDANRITVRTRTDAAGRAVVEIEDTGRGIAPDLLSRVFDPFFTTKDVGEGTGLGLSICHGIVTGLGGEISIESTPDRGTLVRVALAPSLEAELPVPVPIRKPVDEPALVRRPRVMLVDDEPMVAQTIERLLRRDYDITIASCGRDALAHVAGGARFDAIVSDVMMPNMTGIEMLEELQRTAPGQAARVVFLSGGAFTAQTRERLDLLGAPQLEKPVTAKELRACVLRIATEGAAGELRAAGEQDTRATA
ncbi:MAG: ATP-binding protein, partial [Kofleriaceae bacterium]